MILALCLVVGALITVLLIAHGLEHAPEAFEDHNGFHVITARSENAAVSSSGIARGSEFAR